MRFLASLLGFALFSIALSVPVLAAEPSCPTQLEEARTHAALVAQSREQLEMRLAQAIRGNHELSAMAERLSAQNKKLSDEVAALKPKPEAPKAEEPKP